MNPRTLIIFAVVLGALALGWAMRDRSPVVGSPDVTAREPAPAQRKAHDESAEVPRAQRPSSAPAAQSTRALSESPVDVAARAKFNDNARLFFASASSLSEDERRREAGLISEELARLEEAGGLSAGEAFLVRAGLIRATVPGQAEQIAQIKALKERYERDSQRRTAQFAARPDPAFDLYKVREREIIAEVMAMESIPAGVTREEYLRRRLQAAREQLMP
jgi:hypothetical protein